MVSRIDVVGGQVGETARRIKEARQNPNIIRRADEFADAVIEYSGAGMTEEGKVEIISEFEFASNYPDKWCRLHVQSRLVGAMARLRFYDEALAMADKMEDDYERDCAKESVVISLTGDACAFTWIHRKKHENQIKTWIETRLSQNEKRRSLFLRARQIAESMKNEKVRDSALAQLANSCIPLGDYTAAQECVELIQEPGSKELTLQVLAENISELPGRDGLAPFAYMNRDDWKGFYRLVSLLSMAGYSEQMRKASFYAGLISRLAVESPEKQKDIYTRYTAAFPKYVK